MAAIRHSFSSLLPFLLPLAFAAAALIGPFGCSAENKSAVAEEKEAYKCLDLACLCPHFGGKLGQGGKCFLSSGLALRKAVRREYRMLSDEERQRFYGALKALREGGQFDHFTAVYASHARRGGPAFLPWRREFLKEFEIALRLRDPGTALPYWDSTLDGVLAEPKDSLLWSDHFAGRGLLQGRPQVHRQVGEQGMLFGEKDIDWLLNQTDFRMLLGSTAPKKDCPLPVSFNLLEYTQGNVKLFVGGDMIDHATSANDPLFFLHHAFVDLIWELWRQGHQSRTEREQQYPEDNENCADPAHFRDAPMQPFEPMRNIDGLSNKYTDNLYEYAPRPECAGAKECGSRYLFCGRSREGKAHCAAKIMVGGKCEGGGNSTTIAEEMCHGGHCEKGKCQL